jgi:hypothetical protein
MNEPEEFTAPEAVNVSVAQIRSLPDKLLLTIWTNDLQRFVLSRRMAKFLRSCRRDVHHAADLSAMGAR